MTHTELLLKGFPLLQQLDNELYPEGSCNLTAAANCLYFFKAKRDSRYAKFSQFEDELLKRCDDNGWDRHEPETIRKIIELYKCVDKLLIVEGWNFLGAALQRMYAHLQKGNPIIVHTYLTRSGHIVCIDGVRLCDGKPEQWHISDPYGEFYPQGYERNHGGDTSLGRYWLSHAAFTARVLTDGILWAHLVSAGAV